MKEDNLRAEGVGWTCWVCDKGLGMGGRKIITVRVLGENQLIGVCGIQLPQHSHQEIYDKVEDVEHIFFLKRLSNPDYNWANYWNDVYYGDLR